MTASRRLLPATIAIVVIIAIAVIAVAIFKQDDRESAVVSDSIAMEFYKSLAALDVDQSELAAKVLTAAVAKESREPALWGNLAIAHLRLRDLPNARSALETALSLSEDSPELALLTADVLRYSGDTEAAIEQLRAIHDASPLDIAATYSLVTLLSQLRTDEADAERLRLLTEILERRPNNIRAQLEAGRLAASLSQTETLRELLDVLGASKAGWQDSARERFAQAETAARDGLFRDAARALMYTENYLKRHHRYHEGVLELGASSDAPVGTPLRSFLTLRLPPVHAAPADAQLSYEIQPLPKSLEQPAFAMAFDQVGDRAPSVVTISEDTLRTDASVVPRTSVSAPHRSCIAVADLNFDFELDVITLGTKGPELLLGQKDGAFARASTSIENGEHTWQSVWTMDVDADGDIDLLLSDHLSALHWSRNNGDMTFALPTVLAEAHGVRDVTTVDLDNDGLVDLVTLDVNGLAILWMNRRNGVFEKGQELKDRLACAPGDLYRNGQFELVSLTQTGEIRHAGFQAGGDWTESPLAEWSLSLEREKPGDVFLYVADLDNNGAVDLLASRRHETMIWLQDTDRTWVTKSAELFVSSITDFNQDGLLDLVGLTGDGGRVALANGPAKYSWHVLHTLAHTSAGDKRINTFGVDGRIEIRAADVAQATTIRSPKTHFGLGLQSTADIARIVWPNGTVQAEFDLEANVSLETRQRLKASCPWVFAFDGEQFQFVKDFIWRSPLGLRINAQATAGVVQTEDWIKISGDQLAAADGRYSLRITAELWETHFFDHVSLLVVDHPLDTEVLVDERFVPNARPEPKIWTIQPPQPLEGLVGHKGQTLDQALAESDGQYADHFALGKYQGVAEDHWIEFEVPAEAQADGDHEIVLVGNAWIYPTDSSLNVALSQDDTTRPYGLILEQWMPSGDWQILDDNLGFPAGKNKDVVIPLAASSLSRSRRFRLRTNMEIYWDSLHWSRAMDREVKTVRLAAERAELRHRGYSRLYPIDRRRPDTPTYEVESTQQQWLDLEGYYTRFGEIGELLADVDDRYVIMNAGDEIMLEFPANTAPSSKAARDFVLIGDGWVKDGDFNTAFSRFVRPLPHHGESDYTGPLAPLELDPVYQQHAKDWQTFHTRYITPSRFQRGLWPAASQRVGGERQP